MVGGKIGSSATNSQIPMMLYQKALTGVYVGAVFQRLTCRFIGHCLQTWTTRIILKYIFNLPKAPKLARLVLSAQLNTLWIVGTPTITIIKRIIQNVSAQHGRLILNRLPPLGNNRITHCAIIFIPFW